MVLKEVADDAEKIQLLKAVIPAKVSEDIMAYSSTS